MNTNKTNKHPSRKLLTLGVLLLALVGVLLLTGCETTSGGNTNRSRLPGKSCH